MNQHPETCAVCDAIRESPATTNVAIARKLDVGETTVRRHRTHMALSETDDFFGVPSTAITSRGKSYYNRETSTWETVKFNPNTATLLSSLDYDDLEKAVADYHPENPITPAAYSTHTEVFALADAQLGKSMETGGGSKETVERVLASAHAFKRRVEASKPRTIVITDLGDGIENIWNVPSHQLSTNDLDLMAQVRTFRRLLIEVLKLLAPLAPEVYFVSVPSNHGQVRNAPGSSIGTVDNDYGVEISHQLEDVCSNSQSPELSKVRFVRPETYFETATVDVSGTKLAFNHGHRTKGGLNGHDAWWTAQDHGRMPGWDADILLVAHYHTLRIEHSGDRRWIIGVSASEPSSDYFALSTGKRSKRGVTCFRVENGIWSDLEIL